VYLVTAENADHPCSTSCTSCSLAEALGPSGATEKCDPVRRILMDSGSLSHANSGYPGKPRWRAGPLRVSGAGDAQAIQRPSRAAEPSQAIKWVLRGDTMVTLGRF
jgi:hypothetical protein